MSVESAEVRRIFLSYRRDDSIAIAGRIRDRLAARFGADNVFFDIDTIPFGVDFRKYIDRKVAECDVVLVIIGRRWVDARDADDLRRIDQPGDFVRLEVEAALRRDIPVVPLLVDGATIPKPGELPESISGLAYRNGTPVRHDPDFHPDVDRLLRGLASSPPDRPRKVVDRAASAAPPADVRDSRSEPRTARRSVLRGHTDEVLHCAVAPDGTWIVSASRDQTLRIWDAGTGKSRRTLKGHIGAVQGCAVAPDGTWIVSASRDQTLRIWDPLGGVELRVLEGHTRAVYGCAVSPDGTWIVSHSEDDTLRIWDAATGRTRRTIRLYAAVSGVAVSPDGTWIVTASDERLRIWDLASQQTPRTITVSGGLFACAVAPNGTWIVAASDETLRIWDTATGAELRSLEGHTGPVFGCAVAPDGTWIVSASEDKTLRIWDTATGESRRILKCRTPVYQCAVAPDGDWIASPSDRTLRIWDVAS